MYFLKLNIEEQINYKICGIKKLIWKDINNYEDFLKNKDFILFVLEYIIIVIMIIIHYLIN